jgi:hypothetical protein
VLIREAVVSIGKERVEIGEEKDFSVLSNRKTLLLLSLDRLKVG